jgi:hypothetical protein
MFNVHCPMNIEHFFVLHLRLRLESVDDAAETQTCQ